MSVLTFIKMCVIVTSEERSIQDDMTRNAEASEDIVPKLAPLEDLEDQLLEALA